MVIAHPADQEPAFARLRVQRWKSLQAGVPRFGGAETKLQFVRHGMDLFPGQFREHGSERNSSRTVPPPEAPLAQARNR